MDWLLVAWFITSAGVIEATVTSRMNTKHACEVVLVTGRRAGLRGICVYDPKNPL